MAKASAKIVPRTFYLNEHHELPTEEKSGGGRAAQYENIDWAVKGKQLNTSLSGVKKLLSESGDPLSGRQYFLLAAPEPKLTKKSSDKKKAPRGTFEEVTDFRSDHPRVFGRLGLDLIDVIDDGRAIIHATPERIDLILHRTENLDQLNSRDRARWATLKQFEQIPLELRVDGRWLSEISRSAELVDAVIELQPLLTRVESEDVLRGLTSALTSEKGSRLTGTGQDYSGRSWFRGKLSPKAIKQIAEGFFSVQSIHDPLYSTVAIGKGNSSASERVHDGAKNGPDVASLPTVALLDTGVAANHPRLAGYQRGTPLVAPNATGGGSHATYVASRIVFGDVTYDDVDSENLIAECRFLSANVSEYPDRIDDKSVLPMLETLRTAYPDVRVYNLSFSNRASVADLGEIKQREYLQLTRDLDNFAFANDVIVVASAGNSLQGVPPTTPYPDHIDDPNWKMNSWVAGFNTIVTGICQRIETRGTGIANRLAKPFHTNRARHRRMPDAGFLCLRWQLGRELQLSTWSWCGGYEPGRTVGRPVRNVARRSNRGKRVCENSTLSLASLLPVWFSAIRRDRACISFVDGQETGSKRTGQAVG